MTRGAPDNRVSIERYGRWAPVYDSMMRLYPWLPAWRRRAISRLGLSPGEAVLDAACGTGLAFAQVEAAIGAAGRLVGVDSSREMLQKARQRAGSQGWSNTTLLQARAEEVEIGVPADAAIVSFAHDVMRSPEALRNIVRQVKPGGRILAMGNKWAPRWAIPINLATWLVMNRYSATTLEGLERPWDHLEGLLTDLQVQPVLLGGGYVAVGIVPPALPQ